MHTIIINKKTTLNQFCLLPKDDGGLTLLRKHQQILHWTSIKILELFFFAQPVVSQREALEVVSCRVKNTALRFWIPWCLHLDLDSGIESTPLPLICPFFGKPLPLIFGADIIYRWPLSLDSIDRPRAVRLRNGHHPISVSRSLFVFHIIVIIIIFIPLPLLLRETCLEWCRVWSPSPLHSTTLHSHYEAIRSMYLPTYPDHLVQTARRNTRGEREGGGGEGRLTC